MRSRGTGATGERRLDGKGLTLLKTKETPGLFNMVGKIRIGLFFTNTMKTFRLFE